MSNSRKRSSLTKELKAEREALVSQFLFIAHQSIKWHASFEKVLMRKTEFESLTHYQTHLEKYYFSLKVIPSYSLYDELSQKAISPPRNIKIHSSSTKKRPSRSNDPNVFTLYDASYFQQSELKTAFSTEEQTTQDQNHLRPRKKRKIDQNINEAPPIQIFTQAEIQAEAGHDFEAQEFTTLTIDTTVSPQAHQALSPSSFAQDWQAFHFFNTSQNDSPTEIPQVPFSHSSEANSSLYFELNLFFPPKKTEDEVSNPTQNHLGL